MFDVSSNAQGFQQERESQHDDVAFKLACMNFDKQLEEKPDNFVYDIFVMDSSASCIPQTHDMYFCLKFISLTMDIEYFIWIIPKQMMMMILVSKVKTQTVTFHSIANLNSSLGEDFYGNDYPDESSEYSQHSTLSF